MMSVIKTEVWNSNFSLVWIVAINVDFKIGIVDVVKDELC